MNMLYKEMPKFDVGAIVGTKRGSWSYKVIARVHDQGWKYTLRDQACKVIHVDEADIILWDDIIENYESFIEVCDAYLGITFGQGIYNMNSGVPMLRDTYARDLRYIEDKQGVHTGGRIHQDDIDTFVRRLARARGYIPSKTA